MTYKYISFSIAITIISWIVGMAIRAVLCNTIFYNKKLSALNFIKNKRVNNMIGMNIFKWIVKNTFFKFFNQKLTLKNRVEKSDLYKLRNEMTNSEIDHLIGFVFVTVFAFVKFFNAGFLVGFTIMIVNLLLNLYPSLLQQENKRRIDKFIKKIK